jgi:hypothetical protein
MHSLGTALRAVRSACGRAVFVMFIIVVAIFPLPVMPIVLALLKPPRRAVAAQVDRRRERER